MTSIRAELTAALAEVRQLKLQTQRPRVADDLLMLFGRIAGLILLVAITISALLTVFRPSADLSGLANLLNTQLSLIIGAVLGYAAHPTDRAP